MADRFYGAPISAQLPKDVTEQATTTSAVVELRINDTIYSRKIEVLHAIDAIRRYVESKETNPIA